jgi:integrase
MKEKLTKSLIEKTPPSTKDIILRDSEVPGLQCKITPAGNRVFLFYYYNSSTGKEHRPKIGNALQIPLEEARKMARLWAAEIIHGKKPKGERSRGTETRTIEQLAERYLAEHALPHKAASSVEIDRGLLRKHILPTLGTQLIAELKLQDIQRFLNSVGDDSASAANSCRALLSTMFNLAEQWELRTGNPVKGTKKFSVEARKRYLTTEELPRWGKAIREAQKPGKRLGNAVDAIALLLFTGCRKEEILSLKWKSVEMESKLIRLEKDKTNQQTGREVFLNTQAVAILKELSRESEFVFPSPIKPTQFLSDIRGTFESLCNAAKVEDFIPHDLRRTFSTVGRSELGMSFEDVDSLTGHVNKSVSATYAKLTPEKNKALVQRLGDKLEELMKGKVEKGSEPQN